MIFEQEIVTTFLGVSAGFIFSIILFYFTEKIKRDTEDKNLEFNTKKELEYNSNYISKKIIPELNEIKGKIDKEEKFIMGSFEFEKIQKIFIFEALKKGKLYRCLSVDEVTELISSLAFFKNSTTKLHFDLLENYNNKKWPKELYLFHLNSSINKTTEYCKYFKELKIKFSKDMTKKQYVGLIILAIAIFGGIFYWYSYRPNIVKKNCTNEIKAQAKERAKGNAETNKEYQIYKIADYDFYYRWCLQSKGL